MFTLQVGESCPRNASWIFEQGAFLVFFSDLFSVCYMQDVLLLSNIFLILFIFSRELIFTQDEDVLIRHLSPRAGVSKNQQFHSCGFVACLCKECVKYKWWSIKTKEDRSPEGKKMSKSESETTQSGNTDDVVCVKSLFVQLEGKGICVCVAAV